MMGNPRVCQILCLHNSSETSKMVCLTQHSLNNQSSVRGIPPPPSHKRNCKDLQQLKQQLLYCWHLCTTSANHLQQKRRGHHPMRPPVAVIAVLTWPNVQLEKQDARAGLFIRSRCVPTLAVKLRKLDRDFNHNMSCAVIKAGLGASIR